MTEIFDWVGPYTNALKTVSMECQPCRAIGGHSTESYGLWMKGEGMTHQERLFQRDHYLDCNVYLAAGSLATHCQFQHRVIRENLRETLPR